MNDRSEARHHALARKMTPLIIAAFVAMIAAMGLGIWIVSTPSVTEAELDFLQQLSLDHTATGNAIALAINVGFGTIGASFVTLVASVIAGAVTRSWSVGLQFLLLVLVPWLATSAIKLVVQRPRPDMAALAHVLVDVPSSSSFPSGHTAFATALGCAIALTVYLQGRGRGVVWASVALAVVLGTVAGWSRMYLGVHQPSDVLTSLVFIPIAAAATAAVICRVHNGTAVQASKSA